ncbi:mechanosensitive ion channel family protein [Rhodobacteraceae bacterium F11138]|nr:mechanosensitive ion channel family protein [Rhodobacteraceae bacterium F11138]
MVRILCAVVLAIWGGICAAQMTQAERQYYDSWLSLANRAETVIDRAVASNASLDKLRREIVKYRETFGSAQHRNATRIKTLESQLEALGPKPEEGATEPEDIAQLRESLNQQLSDLRVPRVVAEESYNRANGLIGEIDRILRERQTSQLLARGPSPLNPVYWPDAVGDMRTALVGILGETRATWTSTVAVRQVGNDWPVLILLMVGGLILIVMGSRWSERLAAYLRRFGGEGTGVWSFVASLISIILPMIGILLSCSALTRIGFLGERGTNLIETVPWWGAIYLVFRWLGDQVYSGHPSSTVEFRKPHHRTETRLLIRTLAVLLIVHDAIRLFLQIENVSPATNAVVAFLPILLTALVLIRLYRIGMQPRMPETDTSEDAAQRVNIGGLILIIRRGTVALAVISPILAAFGYVNAAEAIVYPAVLTLAVISAILILQRFFGDLIGWLSGRGQAAQESLTTALIGFGLTIAALPVLALVWGARLTDLTELWDRFLAGFNVGGVQVSPTSFLTFTLIFAIGYTVTRLLQGGLRGSLLPKTRIDPGGQNAIVAGVGYVGVFLAAVIAITGAGIDLSSLAIVAGALSVGIGFGLQTIVSNFVSGIILLVERPISKGDWIEVGGLMGYVRDISVRSTRIETFDRTDVIVPNSDLISGTVTNYTRGNTIGRVVVPVGVAYGTDTRKVETLLREIANAHPMVLANPAPSIVFQGFGADSLDFEIRAILRDVNWVLSVKSDMNHEIARRFADEGIEIPFAQRDLWLRNPEALPGAKTFAPSARHNFAKDEANTHIEPENG